jgi:hypothetical protein
MFVEQINWCYSISKYANLNLSFTVEMCRPTIKMNHTHTVAYKKLMLLMSYDGQYSTYCVSLVIPKTLHNTTMITIQLMHSLLLFLVCLGKNSQIKNRKYNPLKSLFNKYIINCYYI